MDEGYGSPLRVVVQRLELMGYTIDNARKRYSELYTLHDIDEERLPFEVLAGALAKVNVSEVNANYSDDHSPGRFVSDEIVERLKLTSEAQDVGLKPDFWDIGLLLENFAPTRRCACLPKTLQTSIWK